MNQIRSWPALPIALLWMVGAQAATPDASPELVETGIFHLHKFEQEIGVEKYRIVKENAGYRITSTFKFVDRGTAVPLKTDLVYAPDLSGLRLHLKGKIARDAVIDDTVNVDGTRIIVRQGKQRTQERKPSQYFLIGSYAPTALQMLFMRYWYSRHQPAKLATFPLGKVRIEHRGLDTFVLNGKSIHLDRYLAYGIVWGREALWLDSRRRLVALVGIDAEFDHFESVRDGYESLLPGLVASAGKDGMAALTALGRELPGSHAPKLALVGASTRRWHGRSADDGDDSPSPGRSHQRSRSVLENCDSAGRRKNRCAWQNDLAWTVGHARAFRAGGVGARIPRCRGHDRA